MSVLVNGSPTEKINIRRGLKQGDPIYSPVLVSFIVAKGLGVLMKRAVEIQCFEGFEIDWQNDIIFHLQYADDTLYVGKATVENLWTLNAIIHGFEMV
ncbi:hypothetical protein QL285_013184 [Trifolium repens]|jgi:hypothetical protein|nr:hypothetical protein QL285_013184 [Trifolium repens]